MGATAREDLADAVAWVREAEDALAAARKHRARAIQRAREAGVPYAELEEVTGLSRGQLDAIRRGQTRRGP